MARAKKADQPQEAIKPTEVKSKKASKDFITGTGRRKTAVASVFMWEQKGEFTVNEKDIDTYFRSSSEEGFWLKPFHLIGLSHPKARFKATIKVSGSGNFSQADAVVHALSRALASINGEYHVILAKAGMLRRDPRMVERKKYFLHKARKGPQYSKR